MAGSPAASLARGRGVQFSGCIASEELGAVGAGIEGWLDNPGLVVSMTQDHIALASRQAMVIETGWKHPEDPQPSVLVHVECMEAGERVTAIQWVVLHNCVAVAVGTSHGSLLFYSQKGTLLLKQVSSIFSKYRIHQGTVVSYLTKQVHCRLGTKHSDFSGSFIIYGRFFRMAQFYDLVSAGIMLWVAIQKTFVFFSRGLFCA